jgi:hypothetical protein
MHGRFPVNVHQPSIRSFGKFSTCVYDRCRLTANGFEYIYVYIYIYIYVWPKLAPFMSSMMGPSLGSANSNLELIVAAKIRSGAKLGPAWV